jgi:hypothetical protein
VTTKNQFVYFISAGGPIKIGTAKDVRSRLSGIQTSNYDALKVLGVMRGGSELEASLHRQFSHYRLRGEWFWRNNDILSYIEQNRDLSLWSNCGPLTKVRPLDPKKDGWGIVQVISEKDERFGQYGYWDDDEEEEVIEQCAYCEGAEKRGLEPDYECAECQREQLAIVYFGKFQDGYHLYRHDELRKVDEEIEISQGYEGAERLIPGILKNPPSEGKTNE